MAYSQTASNAYKVKQLIKSVVAAVVSLVFIGLFHHSARQSDSIEQSVDSTVAVDDAVAHSPFAVKDNRTRHQSPASTSHILPADIAALIEAEKYKQAKRLLLQRATNAVDQSDDHSLATTLSHLAELALLQSDTDTAEVYLAEALDLFQQVDDEVAAAGVFVQLGRLHLVTRQRARLASEAYDTLLVARWKISHDQFYSIENELRRAAENNLALNRFGAAAATYETLFKGYSKQGDYDRAQQAGAEAVKLFASSGQKYNAQAMIDTMRQHGIAESVFTGLQAEIARLSREFNDSVHAMGAARDQALLYNQLQARGDVVNAWRFRQQSEESLAKASARARYRRQPDVLVELYKSNFSMEDAQSSLQQAREVYLRHGMDIQLVNNLQEQIF